jgi:hypothetical protein
MRSVLLSMRQGPVEFSKKTDRASARSVVCANRPRLAACAKRLMGMRFVLSGAAACVLTALVDLHGIPQQDWLTSRTVLRLTGC